MAAAHQAEAYGTDFGPQNIGPTLRLHTAGPHSGGLPASQAERHRARSPGPSGASKGSRTSRKPIDSLVAAAWTARATLRAATAIVSDHAVDRLELSRRLWAIFELSHRHR